VRHRGCGQSLYDRAGLPAILTGDELRALVDAELVLMDVVLSVGMPVQAPMPNGRPSSTRAGV
jgi:hypothetical protein